MGGVGHLCLRHHQCVYCGYVGPLDRAITERTNPDQQPPWAWPQLAASVAQGLINIGARAVVAAGWPVDDHAGRTFIEKFYQRLLDGETLGNAAQSARQRTFEAHPATNT